MAGKLVIFIALTSLSQSSYAQQSPDYGLSESQTVEFREIIGNQDKTLAAIFYVFNSIFDLIEILSTLRRYNLKLENDGTSSVIARVLRTAEYASDYAFESIPVILRRYCYLADSARNAAHGDIRNLYAMIRSTIDLAASGNYSDIRTQLQFFSDQSQISHRNLVRRFYDAVRTCVRTTNADALAEIKVREIETTMALLRSINAVFDAIEIFASGIPAEGDSRAVIPDIKVYRKRAKIEVRNIVEQTYSPLRGLYISTQLHQPEIAARLTQAQYTIILSESRYKTAVEILLDVMRGYLARAELGLSGGCNDDSSALDDAEAEATEYYKVGLRTLVQSVSPTAAAAGSEYINAFASNAATAYYNGVRLARSLEFTYCEALEKVKAIEHEVRVAIPDFIYSTFNTDQPEGNEEGESNVVQSNLIAASQSYVDSVFTGIRVIVKACRNIEAVNAEDLKVLEITTHHVAGTSFVEVSQNKSVRQIPTTSELQPQSYPLCT